MAYLRYVCRNDPVDSGSPEHDTEILIKRCPHCRKFAVAGYRCGCGNIDTDPVDALPGHGPGECVGCPNCGKAGCGCRPLAVSDRDGAGSAQPS